MLLPVFRFLTRSKRPDRTIRISRSRLSAKKQTFSVPIFGRTRIFYEKKKKRKTIKVILWVTIVYVPLYWSSVRKTGTRNIIQPDRDSRRFTILLKLSPINPFVCTPLGMSVQVPQPLQSPPSPSVSCDYANGKRRKKKKRRKRGAGVSTVLRKYFFFFCNVLSTRAARKYSKKQRPPLDIVYILTCMILRFQRITCYSTTFSYGK